MQLLWAIKYFKVDIISSSMLSLVVVYCSLIAFAVICFRMLLIF